MPELPLSNESDQAWFWTPEWQAMEREADEDIAAGRLETFDSMDDLLADLEAVADSTNRKSEKDR